MATRRIICFHDRGFICGINYALKAIEEYSDLEKVKRCLLELKEVKSKWVTDCSIKSARTSVETASVITNYYFVTLKNGEYVIVDKRVGDKVDEIIFWNEDTLTQYVITLCGDFNEIIDKSDNDNEFFGNMLNLIGIDDNCVVINRPMAIDVTHNWRYDHYDL